MTMLDLALSHAQRGWPCFPLAPLSKVPPKGTHGRTDATTDPGQIRRWFDDFVTETKTVAGFGTSTTVRHWNNIGIDTDGAGLVVIDIDTHAVKPARPVHGEVADPQSGLRNNVEDSTELYGHEAWEVMLITSGGDDRTYEVQTPSGGTHLYYQAIPNARVKTVSGKLAPGIDVRAANGSIVAAGSKTEQGEYKVVRNINPKPVPVWLRSALAKAGLLTTEVEQRYRPQPKPVQNKSDYVTKAIQNELNNVRNAPKGAANDALYSAAKSLGRFVKEGLLGKEEITQHLEAAALQRGQGEIEARATIRSGLNK